MNHLRLHTSSSGTNSKNPTSTTSAKPSPEADTDPALAALQAAQIQALYPTLSPSTGSASTSALAALQMQAARAASSSRTTLSQPTTTSSSILPTTMASAMAMASAVQAAQASASAQAAASTRYHPYARTSSQMLPTSIMGGLGAPSPHFPPGLAFPASYLPSTYPPFLQSPYGLPLI